MDPTTAESLIAASRKHIESLMSQYDPSHDYTHILRVLHLSHTLSAAWRQEHPSSKLDSTLVTLTALLHDLGDRKYTPADQDGSTLVLRFLLSHGCPGGYAETVQRLCSAVSYSHETGRPAEVARLCAEFPELAVVQDADRLDAIGAVGIARVFCYAGAREAGKGKGLEVGHFEEKLLRVEGRMKTSRGRELARERTERLRVFLGWWHDETGAVEGV